MVRILARNIQATNMISSFASVFLAAGIIMEEWVVLKLETQTNPISHSPWICCSSVWPEENLEVVRIMMVLVLSLSFIYIFFLGLELFYRIRQTKHVLYIMVFLSFFTGILLLCALLLYQQKLRQGESVYYSSYKITWIIFTAYLSVFFFIVSGFLSLLEHKQSIRGCACLTTIDKPAKESQDLEPSGTSVTVVLLPERTAMP